MEVTLVLHKKDGTRKSFTVPNKAAIIGRRPDCDFCVPLQVISRRHCQLSQEQQTLKLRDLHSSNGTFLNGKKINDETKVNHGDKMRIGPLTFTIKIEAAAESLPGRKSEIAPPAPEPAD